MARRNSKSSQSQATHFLGLAGGLLFILVVGGIVAFLLFGEGGSPQGSSKQVAASGDFDIRDYLDSANALRGNSYRLEGRVEEQLRWTRDRGRLLSVNVSGSTEASPVPVLVPQQFSHVNVEKGTNLALVVDVGDNGLLIARDVRPK
jgi:hypothetical protein